ncbi:3'-hydroxymethylcephem-o-carbamoyltransferase [Pseudomonas amygdali pv. dendropanacis]|uniref:3'-hydroxymethylcephem-o-carbamoyltransferase n=1 Tax=Pseudomonas amygdali pv. dendropanacis TaxID=235272 RepID=A0A0P9PME6_PSEA0|nr:carbamoyltransferase C-terminal domain-containing protein [Pseudomonas amygdali]KPX12204.1 3'-hydroxymethylcephem-o-carbamoyltransferase [Pseudomonas amygdali pv. dendropanacis]KWS80236.1 proline dehydrogenase [Pseudomonas amygdali pv. dendropanacis]
MKIFSMKPGHDGAVALIDTDTATLEWSYEAEKDSFPRYDVFNPALLMDCAQQLDTVPDVVAVSGWAKGGFAANSDIGSGYYGFDGAKNISKNINFFGNTVRYFSSSHLRSHIMSAYAMSPFPQGKACYALVWEGAMGDFYLIDEKVNISHLGTVMITPGNKYGFLYALADPTFRLPKGKQRLGDAGKLMALCAFGSSGQMSSEEQETASFLLDRDSILSSLDKEDMKWSPFYNIGLTNEKFTGFARKFSDELFNRFATFAKDNLTEGYPLLISGGCGLNCDWNTMWLESGIFEDVFIPPCCNDTGSAIGTAVDAMFQLTGNAKLNWDVYCGQPFFDDTPAMSNIETFELNLEHVADLLHKGKVVAWTQGHCEIGPRALGNRSILAAPFTENTRDRLNSIKQREGFRPIAPICLEEEFAEHFGWSKPSPYMLHFQQVRNPDLKAITHVDGTARVQTVSASQNPVMHKLLGEFRKLSGCGVLCNTSLNFNGTGFINRTSDLYRYAIENDVDAFVYDDKLCIIKR